MCDRYDSYLTSHQTHSQIDSTVNAPEVLDVTETRWSGGATTTRRGEDSPVLVFSPLDELLLDSWPVAVQKVVDCMFCVFVLARCLESLESTEIPSAGVLERRDG